MFAIEQKIQENRKGMQGGEINLLDSSFAELK